MNNKIRATTLAAMIATSFPVTSAVIATNADGWEISFGGTVNLFYTTYDSETRVNGVVTGTADEVHLQEGLLPAFATFKAKSPTVNGLTGTAQISFAPDSSNSKLRRQDKGGTAIDMREVFFNVEGSFGTFSVGRTLGIFSRQAILKDQTLFGVGAGGNGDGAGTTLGRIAHGYVYPAFDTRFSYKTPDMNGFQLEVGAYDPLEGDEGPIGGSINNWDTSIPRIEAEATYGTSLSGGSLNLWLGGLWQESDTVGLANGNGIVDLTHWGIDVGAQAIFGGFELVGHYSTGENLGQLFKIAAPVYGTNDTEEDHWYAQVGYTFMGKTKVAASYGESQQKDNGIDSTNELWTIGVYHDVTSWLKLVAEYNDVDSSSDNTGGVTFINNVGNLESVPNTASESQTFSIGAFIFW